MGWVSALGREMDLGLIQSQNARQMASLITDHTQRGDLQLSLEGLESCLLKTNMLQLCIIVMYCK